MNNWALKIFWQIKSQNVFLVPSMCSNTKELWAPAAASTNVFAAYFQWKLNSIKWTNCRVIMPQHKCVCLYVRISSSRVWAGGTLLDASLEGLCLSVWWASGVWGVECFRCWCSACVWSSVQRFCEDSSTSFRWFSWICLVKLFVLKGSGIHFQIFILCFLKLVYTRDRPWLAYSGVLY